MWNYMNFGVNGQIAVAISQTPIGPFTVVNPVLNITRGSSGKFYHIFVNASLIPFKLLDFCVVLCPKKHLR